MMMMMMMMMCGVCGHAPPVSWREKPLAKKELSVGGSSLRRLLRAHSGGSVEPAHNDHTRVCMYEQSAPPTQRCACGRFLLTRLHQAALRLGLGGEERHRKAGVRQLRGGGAHAVWSVRVAADERALHATNGQSCDWGAVGGPNRRQPLVNGDHGVSITLRVQVKMMGLIMIRTG
jgi:hypothetical protein